MASTITADQIIAALGNLNDADVQKVGAALLGQLPWQDVGGQNVVACAMGSRTLISYDHSINYGHTWNATKQKFSKYPRVASSLSFKGVPGATLGVAFQLNVMDSTGTTTQVGESVAEEVAA